MNKIEYPSLDGPNGKIPDRYYMTNDEGYIDHIVEFLYPHNTLFLVSISHRYHSEENESYKDFVLRMAKKYDMKTDLNFESLLIKMTNRDRVMRLDDEAVSTAKALTRVHEAVKNLDL